MRTRWIITYSCHRGEYRDYETVNQAEDDAPPFRRLNSIPRGQGGMVYDIRSGTFIWQRRTSLAANTDWIGRKRENHPTARGSVNLRRRDLTFPSRSDHSQSFFSDRIPFPDVFPATRIIICHLVFNLLSLPRYSPFAALFAESRIVHRSNLIEFN